MDTLINKINDHSLEVQEHFNADELMNTYQQLVFRGAVHVQEVWHTLSQITIIYMKLSVGFECIIHYFSLVTSSLHVKALRILDLKVQ